ncbi:hypothetical protein ACIPVK_11115 [Paeniglutamicibacter sp. MACA_103]|uniref:hypothetical protein n=1 Tax=Paeniglutamicibacter sp. MACA_103 TaxID=3377337 RepID=UPI003895F1B9
MDPGLAVVAGSISTTIFVGSVLPMVVKAVRTRDLASYSLGNLLLANTGNVIHSVYVYSLPAGPIWFMHTFYLATTGFMLAMYLRHAHPKTRILRRSLRLAADRTHGFPEKRRAPDLLASNLLGSTRPALSKEWP